MMIVRGPVGVGKSALARHLASVHGSAYVGQAIPAMQQRSYQPILHALSWPPQPSDPAHMADRVRRQLGQGDLLVLEDLQWADAATLEVLVGLRGHCAIVLTVQDGAASSRPVLRLGESLGASTLELGRLDDAAMEELVRKRAPGLLNGEYRQLVAAAGGVPLLAEVLIASGPEPSMASTKPAATLAALVARRSPAARVGLALLGAAPCPLATGDVDGAEELLAAGMARRVPDGRIEIAHRGLADPAWTAISAEDARCIWRRLVRADGLSDAQRAECQLESGDERAALDLASSAADGPLTRAEQAAALRVAARAARQLLRSDPSAMARDDVELMAIRAAEALNDTASFEAAADLVGDPADFGATTQVLAVVEACRAALGRGDRPAAAEIVRSAGALLDGAAGAGAARARLLRQMLASWEGDNGPPTALQNLAGEFLTAVGSGAERSQAAVMVGLASYWTDVERATEWFRVAKEEAASCRALTAEFEATRNLVMVQIALGRHEEARALATGCAQQASDAGDVAWWTEFTTLDALSRFYDSDEHDDVLSWFSMVRTAPVRLETRAIATSALAALLADRGEVARSAAVLADWIRPEAMDGFEPMVQAMLLWAAAQRAWIIGDLAETIRLARWVTEVVPRGYPTLAGTQVVWRWAEYESGVPITAPTPAGGLLDCAELEAGGIDLLVGGRPAEAAEQFLAAAESWRPILWRCALRSRWAAGHALHLAGQDARAVEVLEQVDAELDRSGIPALRPRIAASLRLAAGRRGGGRRSALGDLVTPQERRVLLLVTEGLTSGEIARRMSVSVATVNSHIRSATRKLGVRTRIEAAAALSRHDGRRR